MKPTNKPKAGKKRTPKKPLSRDQAFIKALNLAIEFQRSNPDDPHGIQIAVLCALTEVRNAARYAANL